MNIQYLTRQLDILPVEKLGAQIHVIGAGAIGSFTVLQLAKLGFENITVYDDDVVSDENMNSQFFRIKDIGKPKVSALWELVKDFTGVEISAKLSRYEGGTLPGIIITAVDSMKARKLVFDNHSCRSALTKIIVDPRMGAENISLQVYAPNDDDDVKGYEATLCTDEAAEQERCTAKSTMYTVNLVSGLVAKTIKDIVLGDTHIRSWLWDIKTSQISVWNSKGENPQYCSSRLPW